MRQEKSRREYCGGMAPSRTPGHLVLPSPVPSAPIATVVWLHGFGDDQPESWASEFKALRDSQPTVQWIHLRAPSLPITCYGGHLFPSWGDFLDDGCVEVGSTDYQNEKIASNATRSEVQGMLETIFSSSVPRVIIGGFSMGAAVAAEAALHYLSRPGPSPKRRNLHLVMLNGWLPPGARRDVANGAAANLRALVSSGTRDEQVGYKCGQEAARLLREGGAEVSWRSDNAASHAESGFGPGRDAAIEFIGALLGQASNSTSGSAGSGVNKSLSRNGKRRRPNEG